MYFCLVGNKIHLHPKYLSSTHSQSGSCLWTRRGEWVRPWLQGGLSLWGGRWWAGGCDALLKVYLECHLATRSQAEGRGVGRGLRWTVARCRRALVRQPPSQRYFFKTREWQDLIYGFQRDWHPGQTGRETRGGCRDGPGRTSPWRRTRGVNPSKKRGSLWLRSF